MNILWGKLKIIPISSSKSPDTVEGNGSKTGSYMSWPSDLWFILLVCASVNRQLEQNILYKDIPQYLQEMGFGHAIDTKIHGCSRPIVSCIYEFYILRFN